MIIRLLISHYALLESLDLELHEGLTTVTGETGAGKSILLGALGLLLGQRADTSVISKGQPKCIIEGHFNIEKLNLKWLFDREELDYAEPCIIRREISNTGKSRSFINDTPVTLPILKELGQSLVEIQTQHTHLMMAQSEVQRALLDTLLEDQRVLIDYQKEFESLTQLQIELEESEVQLSKALLERDYLSFQRNEIMELQLKEDEEVDLEVHINTLSQAQEIQTDFIKARLGLCEGEWNARELLQQVLSQTKHYDTLGDAFKDFNQRIKSILLEVEDLGEEALKISEKFEPNESLLELLNERFQKIQQLLKKHQLQKSSELIALGETLDTVLISTESLEHKISQLKLQIQKSHEECRIKAEQIHHARVLAAKELETNSITILQRLNMPHAQVQFHIDFNIHKLNKYGGDHVVLLFSSNLGVAVQPAGTIASGGELSRLNFAFRNLVSKKKALPTLIYDEADTGISGEVAAKMGELFREMGAHHQILCISHLPQVAAAGHQQWEVVKIQEAEATRSEVHVLNDAERINSIAKMLSGSALTATSKENAKELLHQFDGFKFS